MPGLLQVSFFLMIYSGITAIQCSFVCMVMDLREKIKSFVLLGEFIGQFRINGCESKNPEIIHLNNQFYKEFDERIKTLYQNNGWFTEKNIRNALGALTGYLSPDKLTNWLKNYPLENDKRKTICVIMAGNIPAVGFHDFLCVLLSGNHFLGKLSSDDKFLIPFLSNVLVSIQPGWKHRIQFTEGRPEKPDAVIATGNNNSSRYFEYYFGKYPHIIRKNRNSIAVLSGNESPEELNALGNDIFMYFGLGCRNVSKLYIPAGYDFNSFFESLYPHKEIIQHNKYANNYEYYRTVYLMNKIPLLDNNFLLLKEDAALSSPVGVLHYEYYKNTDSLKGRLKEDVSGIQCIVTNMPGIENAVPFGGTQIPEPWDYADGVDTMGFLLGL